MHGGRVETAPRWAYQPGLWPGVGTAGDVMARLDGLVGQHPRADAQSPQAALKQLLHGQAPYDKRGRR
eukprot:10120299-Lingulodinium_polyedra.AAC.1